MSCSLRLPLIVLFALFGAAATTPVPTAHAAVAPWPDADYDPAVPTLENVVGHAPGERITSPGDALRYLRALAGAAPDRTRLVEYARSWEDRPLVYLLVGSPARIAELDRIKAGMQRLANPRDLPTREADELIASLPAVVWLAYGVHGNEISSTDAALLTAYHLLAARGDERLDALEGEYLVGIDPMQNPDGRARFVQHYRQNFGLQPAGDAIAAERREPWPGGRTNHYLFDMNRDWVPLTQPEVRGRVAVFQQFWPLVHVDLHEMGTDSTYYFPPPARPWNPHITATQRAMLETYGETIARWFDRFDFTYFNRAVYDAYYPGYGDSWPTLQGSVGMTFEMASARGLVGRRRDGSLVTYGDGVQRHFVASLATIEAAATQRTTFLENFLRYRRSALAGAHGGAAEYLLPLTGDASAVRRLADLLVEHGIEVRRLQTPATACRTALAAGSFIVAGRQPAGRLVRTLLEQDSPMDPDFLAQQEQRRAQGRPAQLYDVLGWSLPAMYGVEVMPCDQSVADTVVHQRGQAPATGDVAPTDVAWLVAWGSRAAGRFLAGALREGLVLRSSDQAFELQGRTWPRGTLVLRPADNPAQAPAMLLAEVRSLAAASGATVVATSTGFTREGPSFGSRSMRTLRAPRIALAWDEPTRSYAAGNTRFVLERQFGYPVVPVRTPDLARPEMARFDVLILPDGRDYAGVLGKRGVEALQQWVRRGGVLVATGADAVGSLAGPDMDLLATAPELLADDTGADGGKGDDGGAGPVSGVLIADESEYLAAIAAPAPRPDPLPGVLLRTEPDPEHWLTAGVGAVNFLVEGRDVFRPLTRDAGTNAMRFAARGALPAGGHVWAENQAQWAFKPAVMVTEAGDGVVIGFAADPNFRAALDGANVLFLNAVLRAPAYATPVR